MFFPEPLREVSLFVLRRDLEVVTTTLARLGVLHLEDVEAETWPADASWTTLAARYHGLLQRVEEALRSLGTGSDTTSALPEQLEPGRAWRDLEPEVTILAGRVAAWQQQQRNAEGEVVRLEQLLAQLELLRPLEVPIEALREIRHLHLVIGTLPTENLRRVGEALFQVPFVIVPLERQQLRTMVVAACPPEHEAVFDRALASAFFEVTATPSDARGSPVEALPQLQQRLDDARERVLELERERRQLGRELAPRFGPLQRQLRANALLCDGMTRFRHRGEIFLISGWAPASRMDELFHELQRVTDERTILEVLTPPRTRPDVPTLLRTPSWLQPFTVLVRTFGLSGYGELDPTLIAVPIFLLMYGMMFGDLGHGLLLALGGLALWRWRGVSLGIVVAASGVSGALFGLLYGSVFGFELFHPLWLRPIDDIIGLLLVSLVAGVAVLNLGFLLNLVQAYRVRDWAAFLLEKNGLVELVLYWALLAGGVGLFLGAGVPLFLWLLVVALLGLVLWLREPLLALAGLGGGLRVTVTDVLVTGFFELFETLIGYASNSLSFIRLGAFAVAHEGLARMVLDYSNGSLGWLVLLLGTLLITGFEGLVVGIQALRLEYYEFFGRFFQGRGRPFLPFSLKGGSDARMGIRD